MDLALNNLQSLICHKTQPTNKLAVPFCCFFFSFFHIRNLKIFYNKGFDAVLSMLFLMTVVTCETPTNLRSTEDS